MPGLFESFVQTEAGRRSAEGSGLGLNLSQALVRLMGGEIRVESEVGRGSTFSFDLSLEATAALPGKASGWKPLLLAEGQPALRQLVVDDKASNRDLLTDYMEAIGFPVQSVSNGQEAVEAWRTWQPRVIWMDMRMPVLDGYEATRRIRALEQESGQPRTTIIAITASIFSEDRGGVFSAGCDGIIHKPFREQELFEALAQFAGVVFQERVPEAPAPGREPGPPDLGGLDPVWRQAFYEALRAGDMQEARILASRLPPSQESLSTYLKQALHAFRLDELERLFSTPEAP
jgi:CheY-like chemotaxis protein